MHCINSEHNKKFIIFNTFLLNLRYLAQNLHTLSKYTHRFPAQPHSYCDAGIRRPASPRNQKNGIRAAMRGYYVRASPRNQKNGIRAATRGYDILLPRATKRTASMPYTRGYDVRVVKKFCLKSFAYTNINPGLRRITYSKIPLQENYNA